MHKHFTLKQFRYFLAVAESARDSLGLERVLFIPAGTVHAAKNVGNVPASELATYIVDKSKPLYDYVK